MINTQYQISKMQSIITSLASRGWIEFSLERSPNHMRMVASIRRGDLLLELEWADLLTMEVSDVLMGVLELVQREDIQPGRNYVIAPPMSVHSYNSFDTPLESMSYIRATCRISSPYRAISPFDSGGVTPKNDPILDNYLAVAGSPISKAAKLKSTPVPKGEKWLRSRIEEIRVIGRKDMTG